MKKILLVALLIATAFVQKTVAQTDNNPSLNNVFTAYIKVKNALTADNGDSVRIAAKELSNTIDKVPMEKLPAEQHKIWMQYANDLSYHSEHMKGTDELEHQREHFMTLSTVMYKAMKALNIITTEIYFQFCPMANDGKGAYWLSEQSKIANPYFGKSMPTCGSTKETIKAKQ